MAALLDEILELARTTHSLSEEQVAHILDLAPQMGAEALGELKASLLKLREVEMEDMKKNLAVYKEAAAAYQEWKATQAHAILVKNESADRAAEETHIEDLLLFIK